MKTKRLVELLNEVKAVFCDGENIKRDLRILNEVVNNKFYDSMNEKEIKGLMYAILDDEISSNCIIEEKEDIEEIRAKRLKDILEIQEVRYNLLKMFGSINEGLYVLRKAKETESLEEKKEFECLYKRKEMKFEISLKLEEFENYVLFEAKISSIKSFVAIVDIRNNIMVDMETIENAFGFANWY